MGFWKTERKQPADHPRKAKKPVQGYGSSQTGLRALGTKAVMVGGVVALACGPVALIQNAAQSQVKPVVAPAIVEGGLSTTQQSAGEYGAAFVAAWLTATRDDPTPLDPYIAPSAIKQLSTTPWTYRDLTVVSIEPAEDSELVRVVVAANIEEFDMESDSGATHWPRRYFGATVRAGDDGLTVIGLPSPLSAPSKGDTPVKLAYTESLMGTSSAKETVEAFLNAYLAGSGEIARYVTPGAEITAISPAPFQVLALTDLLGDVEPSDTPSTGAVVHVLATVEASSAAGQQLTATYALTLTARDGRWETTAVDLTPLEASAPAADSDTTTP